MVSKKDVKPVACELYFLPLKTRVPLKFGLETVTHGSSAMVKMTVEDEKGNQAEGWGETPLSVTWVWPGKMPYDEREKVLREFSIDIRDAYASYKLDGHPMEIGHAFIENKLPELLKNLNEKKRKGEEPMPWLSALVCCSAFDIALHDAYGNLHKVEVYKTYNKEYMNRDLSHYITPADDVDFTFRGKYPEDFFVKEVPTRLPAWHLVGGKDVLDDSELTGDEPNDGYPVTLRDWITTDGLKCLKIKLTGIDPEWDYARLVKVGEISIELGVDWLTTDFNCTVKDPGYVNDILDKLMGEYPRIYQMILYVEQPFPYDLEENQIDVHSVSARKPLFMDESAHDWNLVKLGRKLGWSSVALKTCKTQTGALLTLCWAKAHGMTLMVQDLTNPRLAQIPHCLLAAHAGTIMGVETNSMQFYPAASEADAKVHPGLFKRRGGVVDFSTLDGPGFGYRVNDIVRELPAKEA